MKKSFIVAGISLTSFLVFSSIVSAADVATTQQAIGGIKSLSDIVDAITKTLVKALGSLAMAAGVVAFFYGVVEYIWGLREGKTDKIVAGRQFMIWGLIALFVMFSVYGFINFGQQLFFKGVDVTKIVIPEFNFTRGGATTPTPAAADPYANPAGLVPQSNGKFLCPDGVSTVPSASDYGNCPTVSTSYKCPDGTPYYNASDAKYCKSVSAGGSTSGDASVSTPSEQATYQCPDGSMVLPSDAKFCPQAPVSEPSPAPTDVTPAPSESANGCAYDSFGNEICNQ